MGLETRAASVSTGPTGWAEPWNRLGDWQASSESSRARKSTNLMACYPTPIREPQQRGERRPAPLRPHSPLRISDKPGLDVSHHWDVSRWPSLTFTFLANQLHQM